MKTIGFYICMAITMQILFIACTHKTQQINVPRRIEMKGYILSKDITDNTNLYFSPFYFFPVESLDSLHPMDGFDKLKLPLGYGACINSNYYINLINQMGYNLGRYKYCPERSNEFYTFIVNYKCLPVKISFCLDSMDIEKKREIQQDSVVLADNRVKVFRYIPLFPVTINSIRLLLPKDNY